MKRDLRAFAVAEASALTGNSPARLRRWASDGFFSPSLGAFYSFRDLVGLRTLAQMRAKGVPRQQLVKLGTWLRGKHDEPWATLTFSIDSVGGKVRRVAYDDPETGTPIASSPRGQAVAREVIKLERVASETEKRVAEARQRKSAAHGKIETRRGVQGNRPIFEGTRIPVAVVTDLIDDGMTNAEICRQFPALDESDVKAAREHRPRKAS